MKKRMIASACSIFCGVLLGTSILAQGSEDAYLDKNGRFSLNAGIETMEGDTTYRIGFPITLPDGVTYSGYFPFSELEWPLDIELARVGVGIGIAEDFVLRATVKKNVSEPDEYMEDRDWLTWYQSSRLDIYSDSFISDFSALIVDAELQWTFARSSNLAFYTGGGYIYQNFDYEANLIRQYSPSGLPGFDYIGDGRVGITYEIEYHIPYVLIGLDASFFDNFTVSGKIGYSPYAFAKDEDNHLLREYGGKISEGDVDGYAAFLDVAARYAFLEHFFAEIGGSIMRIDMEGTQDQRYVLAGALGEVDMEVVSNQYSVYCNIGLRF